MAQALPRGALAPQRVLPSVGVVGPLRRLVPRDDVVVALLRALGAESAVATRRRRLAGRDLLAPSPPWRAPRVREHTVATATRAMPLAMTKVMRAAMAASVEGASMDATVPSAST